MAYETISCAECGGPALRGRRAKNTKYCRTCALARAVAAVVKHDHACIGCGAMHTVWMGKGEDKCGTCFMVLRPKGGRESVEGTCRLCHQPTVIYTKDTEVCYPCLYNPTNKAVLRLAIEKKQIARLTAVRKGGTL